MKIKFLKDTHIQKQNDIEDIDAFHANALIKLGYAELAEDTKPNTKDKLKPATKKTATKKTTNKE